MIKAILFDLDGVLIETEKETFEFYQTYLKTKGVNLKDEDFRYKAGRKSVDFWNDVLTPEQQKQINIKELTQLKREIFNTKPEKYIKKVPGGKELIASLKNNNFKLALVSQNESRMINSMVDWLDIRKYFNVILSIEEITRLKPDPEIYLLAAKSLAVEPNECIVIEDSKDGIGSAKNAKMKCIAVHHDYMPEGNSVAADIIVEKLTDINLDLIANL